MSLKTEKQRTINALLIKWLPVLFTALLIFAVPPAALAVILAYFTAPILTAVRSVLKLPLTIATFLVMLLLTLLTSTFTYIALQGIFNMIPAVEHHLTPFTQNTDIIGQTLTFLESKIVQFGQAILEYLLALIQTVFQHLFSLFIFLVAYFFALRETGKDRFWFLVYFPTKMRKSARNMLKEAAHLISTFVFVEVRLILITFFILSFGLVFLRFNSPIGTAFLISLVDSLPFFGVGLFLIPMAIYFIYTENLFIGISLILLYILTLITRQIAESYMYASTFQLKPVHAFFIMACTIYLFGVVGIFLTPFLLFAAMKAKNHALFTS
ncbi:AI-2E family transporter [Sporosarcina siberiensis]|uniref:AI-2E family transporter n=1 Tax=Sporosarcina siberiensis TaxID=1365606 RepID=A0ABW4SCR6_9BACL